MNGIIVGIDVSKEIFDAAVVIIIKFYCFFMLYILYRFYKVRNLS
ncbi:hypothetical protein [Orientia tsutsugamushi]|nr:hypothetical protein [Orientia tsutsugamushi]KJV50530.1 putative membrane protein [Orientia tsutsugamushi str. Karp]KJV54474.1 putative membrane protein [Orientia tsutsugamushi str. Kato PP]KJV75635.1 putative membrane protein [Orientia tsutsugamushi str. TA763]